jgi:hypothetical protein
VLQGMQSLARGLDRFFWTTSIVMVMNHRYFCAVIEDGENMTVVITKTLEFVAIAGKRQVRLKGN